MSGSDIRTDAWEGRWADFVDIARLFSPCVRLSGGGGGRISGGVGLADIPGHGRWGGKSDPRFLPLTSCFWFLVSGLLPLAFSRMGNRAPLDEACRWHAWRVDSDSPTVGTVGWDEMSRCDGGSGSAAVFWLFVICYWGMRFSSTTHDLPSPIFKSPSRLWRLCGESFRRG